MLLILAMPGNAKIKNMPLRPILPAVFAWIFAASVGAGPARADDAVQSGGPFADDLGYPWAGGVPYGASALYHLTAPRAALGYRRAETSDIRRSSVSKTTADGYRDVAEVSVYAPMTDGLTVGAEGFARRGKTEVTFSATGLDDLTYLYERNVRSVSALAAFDVSSSVSVGARYGAYYLEDFADTSALGAFGEKTSDKQNFRVLEPALSWHDDRSEVTIQHQPKVHRVRGDSVVAAPAVASLWCLYKPRAPTTLMAGFAYGWYGALKDGQVNAPEIAVGQRRWTEYGDLGLVLRYAAKHYAQKTDVQPDNVELTTIEFVSHAQIVGDAELQVRVGYGIGSGKGKTEARSVDVDTEQVDGMLSLEKKF